MGRGRKRRGGEGEGGRGIGGGRGGDEERFITPLQSCDHAYPHLIHFPPSLHPSQWI